MPCASLRGQASFTCNISQMPAIHSFRWSHGCISNTIYRIGVLLTKPFLYVAQIATRLFCKNTPSGSNSGRLSKWQKAGRVIETIGLFTLVMPIITGVIALIGWILRLSAGGCRPHAMLIENRNLPFKKTERGETIDLMTYNAALMPNFICKVNNMRPPGERAIEIARMFEKLEQQGDAPDFVCFQETFDTEKSYSLCERLKAIYPQQITAIAPSEFGLNSGLTIASKYAIEQISYRAFTSAGAEDALANKGAVRAVIKLNETDRAVIYNVHLQAKRGERYANIRQEQIAQLRRWVEADGRQQTVAKVLVAGDFNLAHQDENGEFTNEFTHATKTLGSDFVNLFYQDHDQYGQRRSGGAEEKEPHGSFYTERDNWGTPLWRQEAIPGYVLDHCFVYVPDDNEQTLLQTYSQICSLEHKWAISGHSDHLPVRYKVAA